MLDLAGDEIELVAPLWATLQEHHARITPELAHAGKRDREESWRRRRARYVRWLQEPDTFVLVAERAGQAVGYAFVTVGPGSASWSSGERIAELQTLSVAPAQRGAGIGTKLLDAVAGRLASIGVDELLVTSTVTNADAHRFYARRGLRPAFLVLFGRATGTEASAARPAAPVILGLDHVQVAAPPGCEAEARRFYGGLLGLAEVPKPEPLVARGGVWFALGAGQLHVGVEAPFNPAGKAHPALRVAPERLDALAATLAEAGAPVRWDGELPGVRRFYAKDPWGNRLELLAAAS